MYRWCTISGVGANVIDEDGRVICSERPSGAQVATTSETTTTITSGVYAGAAKRTTTVSGPIGTSQTSFITETAWGLRLEEGALQSGSGNVVQHRVASAGASTSRSALLEALTLERRADGAIFSKTARSYDSFGNLSGVTIRDASDSIVRQQTFENHDLDGRAATHKQWKTSTTFDTTTYEWNQATDLLEAVVEADQAPAAHKTDLVYGAGAKGAGRLVEVKRGPTATPTTVRRFAPDEAGDIQESAVSNTSLYDDAAWSYDGFGRVVRDSNLGADVAEDLTCSRRPKSASF